MRHPAVIVLNALMRGQVVTLGDTRYAISEDNKLMSVFEDGESGYTLEWTVNWFIKACERLTPEEVAVIAAENALRP